MPTKEKYRKIKLNKIKCPKCSRVLDDKDFVTCSKCRNEREEKKLDKELRRQVMELITGPRK